MWFARDSAEEDPSHSSIHCSNWPVKSTDNVVTPGILESIKDEDKEKRYIEIRGRTTGPAGRSE